MELWAHQKEAVERFTKEPIGALFFEMGTGKTGTVWSIIRRLDGPKTIILAPLVVVRQWKAECLKFAPELFSQVGCAEGTAQKRIDALTKYRIVVVNHEALRTPAVFAAAMARGDELVVVDESTRVKNPWAKLTQCIIALADRARRKLILTGRPVLKNGQDLFAQFRVLSPDILGRNFYQFRNAYFYDKNARMPKATHFPDWQIKPHMESRLKAIVAKYAMVRKKAEVLDLPPLVKSVHEVDLTTEQSRIYHEMERDMIASMGDGLIVANLTLEKMLRLQQIACGIGKDVDGHVRFLDTAKEGATRELLEDLCDEHKVILWTHYEANYARLAEICHKLNLEFVTIIGGQGAQVRDDNVRRFNSDPQVRVCIANQAAGGIGIGLQAASYAIYYSKGHSLEHDCQSEARNHRGGSEIHQKITRIDLITRGTIEADIHTALAEKLSLSDLLINVRKRVHGTDISAGEESRRCGVACETGSGQAEGGCEESDGDARAARGRVKASA